VFTIPPATPTASIRKTDAMMPNALSAMYNTPRTFTCVVIEISNKGPALSERSESKGRLYYYLQPEAP
jgi:hypothetical protein